MTLEPLENYGSAIWHKDSLSGTRVWNWCVKTSIQKSLSFHYSFICTVFVWEQLHWLHSCTHLVRASDNWTYPTTLLECLAYSPWRQLYSPVLLRTWRACGSPTPSLTMLTSMELYWPPSYSPLPLTVLDWKYWPSLITILVYLDYVQLWRTFRYDWRSFHSYTDVTCEMLNILHPNSLTKIDLSMNASIFGGTTGTLVLAKFLQVFQSLEQLDCSDCSLLCRHHNAYPPSQIR